MFCFLIVLVISSGCEQIDRSSEETEPSQDGRCGAGRVLHGPEYLLILDGMTGEMRAQSDWPSRDGLGEYNHYSRSLMGVAYLDGKPPGLVAARGTYTVNKLETYQYQHNQLEKLWEWDSTEGPGGLFYGQGDHFIHTTDVTGDGRDEIILGAATGEMLWGLDERTYHDRSGVAHLSMGYGQPPLTSYSIGENGYK